MGAQKRSLFPVGQDLGADAAEIERQLLRVLESPEFKATAQQRAMLEFVVSETLAGRAAEIKGYTVATRVFGRSEDFDQATDPIVGIQANKLRRALERYYLIAGRHDPVCIGIPIGTYVPSFRQQTPVQSDTGMEPRIRFMEAFPAVLVRPFRNLSGDPGLDYLGIGLAAELAIEMARYQEIRVLQYDLEAKTAHRLPEPARFAIEGSVRRDVSGIKVTVDLLDTTDRRQIWGDRYRSDFGADRMIAFQEHVAAMVTAKIAGESGIIAKTLAVESRHLPPSDLRTYEAMLRYQEFNANFTREGFYGAFEALRHAAAKEPECGMIWSMLARLYATNYSLELFDVETSLEEAVSFAKRGVKLDPGNQRGRLILAYVLLFENEFNAGLAETERTLALNHNSLIYLENLGYLMALFGDWDRGTALIRKALTLNPYYNIIVHYALWVDWVRQGNYQQAYLETLNFRFPMLFWDPLMKAAAFGLLSRIEEGRRTLKSLLKLKPDFPLRGRVLIKHYIKFQDIVERTVAGLNRVGLNLE